MANKQALRELQTRLAERLQAARTQARGKSWLAVECSGHGFLLPLSDAGEIFAIAPLLPVPHSQPWFLGVANLRGHLHGVVDLAAFLGIKPVRRRREQARLVGFNQALDINCVLLVDRLAGLRSEAELSADAADDAARPGFVGTLLPRCRRAAVAGAGPGRAGGRRRIPRHRRAERGPLNKNRRRSYEGHMSFLNKIKGWGRRDDAADADGLEHELAFTEGYAHGGAIEVALPARCRGVRGQGPRPVDHRRGAAVGDAPTSARRAPRDAGRARRPAACR